MVERSQIIDDRGFRYLHLVPEVPKDGTRPIWFVPGLGFRPDHYKPFLKELAKTHEVYASEFTWELSGLAITDYIERVRKLKAELGIGPHIQIAHSLGAIPTLLEAHGTQPTQIEKIICINPAVPLTQLGLKDLFRASTGGFRILANDLFGLSAGVTSRDFALTLIAEGPAILKTTLATLAKRDLLAAWRDAYLAMPDMPTMVIASGKDEYFLPAVVQRAFGETVDFHVHRDLTHHGLNFEPERVAATVRAFLI